MNNETYPPQTLETDDDALTIVVVEDDLEVRTSLGRALRIEGYNVLETINGLEGLEAIREHQPDIILADIMMPEMDGLEMCRALRASGNMTPILMLTALTDTDDKVAGLDAGADDYLVKPFALKELLARLRALGRRVEAGGGDVEVADIVLKPASREAYAFGNPLNLTKTEYNLLLHLAKNHDKAISRSELNAEIWGFDFETSSNSLDVYIGYLRKKLEAGNNPRRIETVRGIGYMIKSEPDA